MGNVPLTSKFCFEGRGIFFAVALAVLVSPHEASAKGGVFHLFPAVVGAEAATTTTTSRPEPPTVILGGCGGKRYRDPNTHRCRGPGDFGN
jgi:hypothetical protein